jgi:hypothetical protein
MYSFSRKNSHNPFIGCFMQESLNTGVYSHQKKLPGIILEICVSSNEYQRLTEIIKNFSLNSQHYKYNYFGLLGCFLGFETHTENRFVCSSFVYHVLNKTTICNLNIPYSLVKPEHLLQIEGNVVFEGDLQNYTANTSYAA